MEKAVDAVKEEPSSKLRRRWRAKRPAGQWVLEKLSSRWAIPTYSAVVGVILGIVLVSPMPEMLKGRLYGTGSEVPDHSLQARRLYVGNGGRNLLRPSKRHWIKHSREIQLRYLRESIVSRWF